MNKAVYLIIPLIVLAVGLSLFIDTGENDKQVNEVSIPRVGVSIGIPFNELEYSKQIEIREMIAEKGAELSEEEIMDSRYLTRNNVPEIDLKGGEIIILTN